MNRVVLTSSGQQILQSLQPLDAKPSKPLLIEDESFMNMLDRELDDYKEQPRALKSNRSNIANKYRFRELPSKENSTFQQSFTQREEISDQQFQKFNEFVKRDIDRSLLEKRQQQIRFQQKIQQKYKNIQNQWQSVRFLTDSENLHEQYKKNKEVPFQSLGQIEDIIRSPVLRNIAEPGLHQSIKYILKVCKAENARPLKLLTLFL